MKWRGEEGAADLDGNRECWEEVAEINWHKLGGASNGEPEVPGWGGCV